MKRSILLTAVAATGLLAVAACNRPAEEPAPAADDAVDAAATDATGDTASAATASGAPSSTGAGQSAGSGMASTEPAPSSSPTNASSATTSPPAEAEQVPGGVTAPGEPVPVRGGYATQGPRDPRDAQR